jgi:hypothetical protein
MASIEDRIVDRTLSLAWSLWTEMGVPGTEDRRHSDVALDPEALVLLTAGVQDDDPRLRDEALDWCIRYGQFISGSRLRNLLSRSNERTREGFGVFAATVNENSGLRWRGATEPRRYEPTRRSRIEDFTRPSLITLRLRALFGVNAKAEVLRVYASDPEAEHSASDLAREVGFTKRSVWNALDGLSKGGLLEALPVRNSIRYRLRTPSLLKFIGRRPKKFWKWTFIVRVVGEVRAILDRSGSYGEVARDVEIRRAYEDLIPDIAALRLRHPTHLEGERFLPAFEKWAFELVRDLAGGSYR